MKRHLTIIGTTVAIMMLLHSCTQNTNDTDNRTISTPVGEETRDSVRVQDTLAQVPEGFADVRYPDMKVRVRKGSALLLETEGFRLTAVDTAVRHAGVYSVTSLEAEDLAPLPQGMRNMTASTAGYRLLPGGEHFSPYAEVRVAYDPARLPLGYTPEDIYTSYYDTVSLAWVRLERLEVDTVNREIVSATSHFTDFINELLQSPEMPETQAFVPTQMSGLEAANPLDGYSTIAPPEPNNMGTANLTYPIQVPVGRGGMQPHIMLTYNSNGGNGVCGMGWDLQIPCISVETRWGVPLYDADYETETYLFNGEQLLVNHDSLPTFARSYEIRDTNYTKRFYPRVEGSFDSILRHGTSPQTYWWEIYDRQGTCYIYGLGDGELRSQRKNAIAKWYLTRVIDRSGNTARYHYSIRKKYVDGRTSGTAVYLDKISYTSPEDGFPSKPWYGYCVSFHYNDGRTDPVISGNYGVKENICGRLDSIKTWYVKNDSVTISSEFVQIIQNQNFSQYGANEAAVLSDLAGDNPDSNRLITTARRILNNDAYMQSDSSLIRGYRLLYTTSATGKSLLSAVVEMSPDEWEINARRVSVNDLKDGSIFKYHIFSYQNLKSHVFGPAVTLSTDIEGAESGMANLDASPLGGSKSSNNSYSFSAGVGLGCKSSERTINIEGSGSFSPKSASEGTTSIIDINGDGYPDLLYKKSGVWKCQLFSPQQNSYRSADSVYLTLPTDGFSKSITKDDYSLGLGVHVGRENKNGGTGVNIGAQYTHSSSDNTMYFTDVNADGKPDIVKDGIVWFNNSFGDTITFDREFWPHMSPDKPCEISYFAIDRSEGLNSSIFEEGHHATTYISWIRKEDNNDTTASVSTVLSPHTQDTLRRSVVRVWIAPDSGEVVIVGIARLDSSFNIARERTNADGVRVSIQHNNSIVFGTAYDLTKQNPLHDMSVPKGLVVEKGDRIYFRVESLENDLYDIVGWEPTLFYRYKNLSTLDAAGRPKYIFNAKNDFLAWKDERFSIPQNGTVHVSAGYQYTETLPSYKTITLKIIKADTSGNILSVIDSRNIPTISSRSPRNSGELSWEQNIILDTNEILYFSAESSHPVDWTKLQWFPHITSVSFLSGDSSQFTILDENGNPQIKKAIDIYMSPILPKESLNLGSVTLPVDDSVFGNINHCWGNFVYNSNTMRTPIVESKIVKDSRYQRTRVQNITDSVRGSYNQSVSEDDLRTGIENLIPNPDQEDASSLDALYEPDRMSNRILVGYAGKNYVTPTQMGLYNWHSVQAAMGDSALLVPVTNQSIAATGMTAVGPVKGTYQNGFGVHASLGLSLGNNNNNFSGNVCANYSNGENGLTADFVDFNGDGYPDVISETEAQYTNPWGGLSDKTAGINPLEEPGIQTTVYNAYSLQGGASYAHYTKNGKNHSSVHILLRNEQVGINGGVGENVAFSSDHTDLVWIDINGDGLPDCLREDQVALNLGYDFYYSTGHSLPDYDPTMNESNCYNISANLAGEGAAAADYLLDNTVTSTVNKSFVASASGSKSINSSDVMYADINGDGLVDKIKKTSTGSRIFYNTGWGYDNQYCQDISTATLSKDISNSYGFSGNITLGFPVTFLGACFKVQGSAGLSTNGTASTTQVMLMDMNADGLPDKVTRNNDGKRINVMYNQLYDVDKLISVQSFYGNQMDIAYAQADYSERARQRPTVMSNLVVRDATSLSNDYRDFHFQYKNYVHSIEERTPYGFDSVIVTQWLNNSPYRITRQHYRTDLYKMRGRKASELVTDANGRPYVGNEWSYQLKLIENGNVVPVNMAHCYGAAWPALDAVFTHHYNPQSGLVEIATEEKYNHIDSGRVGEYINFNNIATAGDDVHCFVNYTRCIRNQSAQPKSMTVSNNANVQLRNRVAEYDSCGRLTGLKCHTDELGYATESYYTYDDYGNIQTVKLPPNENGENPLFEYTYDSLVHMFCTLVVDAGFNDTSRTEYDVRLGLPLRVYSKGGDSISYTYDGWGRPRTIRAPQEHDTSGVPTIRYLYWDDHNSMAPLIELPNFRSFTGIRVLPGRLKQPCCDYYKGWPIWAQTLHSSAEDPNLDVTTVLFVDGHGRVLQTKKTAMVNGNIQQVVSGHVVYDNIGRPIRSYEPFVTQDPYCDYSKPELEGVMTLTDYDILDRVVRTEVYPQNIITRNRYNFGTLGGQKYFKTETIDPEGRTSAVLTDARGLTINSIDALQGVTSFEYDALGQLLISYDPENFVTEYGYDKMGHLRYRVHPDAGRTDYEYDPAGNLIKEENPLGEIFYDYTYYRLTGKRYSNMSDNDVSYEYGSTGTATGLPVRITDGSGVQTLEYDALGNVSKIVRVMSIPTTEYACVFTHSFHHDSWGRMLSMSYPDGEQVDYGYNPAGGLMEMTGVKDGHFRFYIKSIDYNKYGQRTYILYGNDSHTEYTYDPLQRLSHLYSEDAHNHVMQNTTYTFNKVNDITQLQNVASSIGGLGGTYTNTYIYDNLDRLVGAHGSGTVDGHTREFHINEMYYSASGRLGIKDQYWNSVTNVGSQQITYGYPGSDPNDRPHAPRLIDDQATGNIYGLEWDSAGNLLQVGNAHDYTARFLYWTEDNRLHTVADEKYYSYYAYDHSGQRTLKMAGEATFIDLNAWGQDISSILDRVTMYPSAYLVLSERGYTKHYYAGADRVAARIGGGDLSYDTVFMVQNDSVAQRAGRLFWNSNYQVNHFEINHQNLQEMNIMDIDGNEMSAAYDFDMNKVPTSMQAEVYTDLWTIYDMLDNLSRPNYTVGPGEDDEPEVYFYHSDHLGGASWITDSDGDPVQHLQYLPFGEPFVDQHPAGYQERYRFTGKERDEETGYGYFGARYMDNELTTSFISVDRYASKYPSISPYAYCAWNPIRLTDPSGDSVVLNGDAKLINYAVSDMQKRTKNLQLSVNEKGAVSYSGKPVTEEEVYMAGIIDNKQVKVNIFLQKDSKIRDNIEMFEGACDAFDGSDVYKDNQGNLKANAIQYVNVLAMMSLDPSKSGDCMWHAVSEAFEGANMALDLGHSVRFNDPDYWYVYNISHNNANYRFCGNVSGFGFNPEKIVYTIDRF